MQGKKNKNSTSKGRQKISITKIEEKSNLQVTFSKRRTGLFKKAGELCILSGAEIAILVFSPKDKPYSFAHPNLNSVLNRFFNEEKDEAPRNYDDDASAPRFKAFNDEYEAALRELEKEKKKKSGGNSKKGSGSDAVNGGGFWWDSVNVDEMTSLEEVEEYARALEELDVNLKRRTRQQMIDAWTTVAAAGCGGGNGGGGPLMMGMDNNWFGGIKDKVVFMVMKVIIGSMFELI